MTEIASIVANLTAVSTALEGACKQLIATAQAMPAQGTSTPTVIDLKQLADHTIRHTALVREVAGRLDMSVLAQEFDTSDIAGAIDLSDLANEISTRDIADEIDMDDLRDKCVDAMSSDIDTEEIARKAAEEIDAAAVAQELDTATIAEEIVDSLDLDEMADSIATSLDAEQLETIGSSLCDHMTGSPETMREIVSALAAQPVFVNAIAEAMARLMVAGAGFSGVTRVQEPEPHGARDTFVPVTDGPTEEQFNTMQA